MNVITVLLSGNFILYGVKDSNIQALYKVLPQTQLTLQVSSDLILYMNYEFPELLIEAVCDLLIELLSAIIKVVLLQDTDSLKLCEIAVLFCTGICWVKFRKRLDREKRASENRLVCLCTVPAIQLKVQKWSLLCLMLSRH